MKITKEELREIIKEELEQNINNDSIGELTDKSVSNIIKKRGYIKVNPITKVQVGDVTLSYGVDGRLFRIEKGDISVDTDTLAQYWHKNGVLHRDGDDPAVTYKDGSLTQWYKNGKLHRDNGPAIIYGNNTASWYTKGKFMRREKI